MGYGGGGKREIIYLSLHLFVVVHRFYVALFSALEQNHCSHVHVILTE